ncbi:MAG: ABC transporter permease [Candidatus Aphodosoma sp.]
MTDFLQEIFSTLSRNKARCLLTAFGVSWGVFMLVTLMGVGHGIRRSLFEELDGIAQNTAFIFSNNTTEPYKGFAKGRYWNFTENDLTAIRHSYSKELKAIMPIMWGNYQSENNVVRGTKAGAFRVMGFTKEYKTAMSLKITEGRFINDIDVADARKNCVIGERVRNDLFAPNEEAIGQLLRVNGIYYTVVGVADNSSDNFMIFGDTKEMIMLPYTTVQQANNSGNTVHAIGIVARDDADIKALSQDIKTLLRQRNNISPTDEVAVDHFDLKEIFDMWSKLFLALDTLIWIVGLGTLLAGVIGVSNIMLITVRERTVEIGIRRALGATPWSIIRQILSESLLLTLLAGMAGVIVSVLVLGAAESIIGNSGAMIKYLQVDFTTAMTAVIAISLTGVFSGYLPAKRALSIKAVEALQDE